MMLTNISFREARDLLMDRAERLRPFAGIPLERSLGRVLAEDVYAAEDVPPFDKSPFDGYALRASDTVGASREHPVTLRILEEVPAGSMWKKTVEPGTATKILTGAPVPEGADTTVKYEDTAFTSGAVTIFSECRSMDNVVVRGEDVQKGQLLAEMGTEIDGALMGTLAAQHIPEPMVFSVPRVGIVTTGS